MPDRIDQIIIAVGGTGQVVLHHYAQLYLLGLADKPFHAIVVDTDELNKGLRIAREFFRLLQAGSQKTQGVGGLVPTMEFVRVKTDGQNKFAQALTTCADPNVIPLDHPVRAFFDQDALRQDVREGLYARPALSTVMTSKWLTQTNLPLATNVKIVLVGSLLGGTGGGLLAPLVAQILELKGHEQLNLSLRAVLFGEYFKPDPNIIKPARLKSNLIQCLRSLEEIHEQIALYVIVGGPQEEYLEKRDHQREKVGTPSWPMTEEDPAWRGTQALAYLLGETIQPQRGDFPAKEVDLGQASQESHLQLKATAEVLRKRLGRAQALVENRVLPRMASDPFAALVWGGRLTKLAADFRKVALNAAEGEEYVGDFFKLVQNSLEDLWGKEGEGLRSFFPAESPVIEPSLRSFARLPWPEIDRTAMEQDIFRASNDRVLRPAATLLFWALRG